MAVDLKSVLIQALKIVEITLSHRPGRRTVDDQDGWFLRAVDRFFRGNDGDARRQTEQGETNARHDGVLQVTVGFVENIVHWARWDTL